MLLTLDQSDQFSFLAQMKLLVGCFVKAMALHPHMATQKADKISPLITNLVNRTGLDRLVSFEFAKGRL